MNDPHDHLHSHQVIQIDLLHFLQALKGFKPPSKCFLIPKRQLENSDACSLILGGNFE